MNYNKEIAKRIKELRLQKGMTIEQLAWGGGIAKSTVSSAEKGDKGVNFNTLLCICTSMKISLAEFFSVFDEVVEIEEN